MLENTEKSAARDAVTPAADPLQKPERNYGLDALRMVSMFMIVWLHLLGHGGILQATEYNETSRQVAWFIELLCYGAVNVYALISGYVGVRSKFKITNFVVLWLQVVFYSVLITLAFAIFQPGSVTVAQIFRAFLPLTSNLAVHWYFACYAILFFFMPALNAAIHTLPQKKMLAAVLGLLSLTFVYWLFGTGVFGTAPTDIFGLKSGYSVLWLAILYLVGAYISKYELFKSLPKSACLIVYFAASVLSWGFFIFSGNSGLILYISPTITAGSIALLLLFRNVPCKRTAKIIKFLSPLTFGVYLIHEHTLIRNEFMTGLTRHLATRSAIYMVAVLLLYSLIIYFSCMAIDLLRSYLFKWLKIKQRVQALEDRLLGK